MTARLNYGLSIKNMAQMVLSQGEAGGKTETPPRKKLPLKKKPLQPIDPAEFEEEKDHE